MNDVIDKLKFWQDHPHAGLPSYIEQAIAEIERLTCSDITIGKIWKILGITTYEQAHGKSIDELVFKLQAENGSMKAFLACELDTLDAFIPLMKDPEKSNMQALKNRIERELKGGA